MRKIISLLMIALAVFFAMPGSFALNPPNPAPTTGPSSSEEPKDDPCKKDPNLPQCPKNPCTLNPEQCSQTCEENRCQEKCKTPCKKCCDKKKGAKNACKGPCSIDMSIPFGGILHRYDASALLTLHKDKASSSLFSPQSLEYSLQEASTIAAVQTENLTDGISREVAVQRTNGEYVYYSFKTGESIGYPSGDTIRFTSKLIMLDANGTQVTDSPVFYDRVLSDTTRMRYSATAKTIVYIMNPDGTKIDISNPLFGMDIIRDDSNNLRQIWSMLDGLCDIVVIDDYKYEIRLYNPENAGSKDPSTGLYVPTGTPRSVWSIENPLRSDTNFDNVKITEQANGALYVYNWQYNELLEQWTLTIEGSSIVSTMSKLWNAAHTTMNFIQEVKDTSGNLAYRRYGITVKKAWGDVTTEEHIGSDASPLTSFYYTYYEDSTQTGKYSRLKSIKKNNYWVLCDYDSEGRKTYASEVWMDAAFGSSSDQIKEYYYSYTPVDPEDVLEFNDQRYRTVDIRIKNIPVQKIYYVYKTNANGEKVEIVEDATSPTASYGAAGNMRSMATYYSESAGEKLEGRVKSIVKSDGTVKNYTYEYGSYAPNADPALSTFTPGTGYAMRTTVTNGTTSSPDGIAGKTLREVTVSDEFGNDVLEEEYIYTGSSYEKISWTANIYDSEHHVTASYASNNTSTAATWNCCNKASETTSAGIEYTYSYNVFKLLAAETRKGYNGTADIVKSYTYNVDGRLIGETVSADGLSLSTSKTYDLMSRILSETDASGLTTTYAYSSDGKTTTKTLPGGFTEITENYADGQIKSVTGTAVVAKYYEYGVNSDGTHWAQIYQATAGGPRWTKTTTDMLARTIKEEQPGYNGSTIVTQYFYNAKSQLVKVSKTGSADTLYSYDDVGNLYRSCLDVNANGTIDLASMDRVTENDSSVVYEDSAWWQKSISKVYAADNDSTATTTGSSRNRLTGFAAGVVSERQSTDIHGNITTSTTTLDATNKTVTRTTDVPDSTVDAVQIAVNGLTTSSRSTTNLTATYSYDDLGRQIGVTDPRTGTSVTHYNAFNQVDYVEEAAGNRTSYSYETATGRISSVSNALNKSTNYTYNERGQTLSIRGDTEYPIDYVYDSYGQMTQLKTYRQDMNTPDITTWNYEPATGFVTAKIYADNKQTTYTYTTAGRPVTRTWARGLTTTYSYNPLDELSGVDYSDNTPDIAFSYDRLGRQKTVTDAAGTRTFTYNSALQLTSEAISGIYSKELLRSYDSTGRYSGMNIGTEYDVDYGYDSYGRFSTLTNGADVYTYNYLANSNLLASINYPHDITTTNSYESNRNLLTSIENKYDTTIISKYSYNNDAIGRRTSMGKSGTAFTLNDTINYGYDDRSEVSSAIAVNNTNYNYGYTFDYIGNRLTSTLAGTTTNYISNVINQYTAIDSQIPTYDDDGNMTSDGTWTYTWNAENRIVSKSDASVKLEYEYDYAGRRIEEKTYNKTGSIWTLSKHSYFVYSNWNKIEELNALSSNDVLVKRVWGLDISGSLDRLGGVGALLSETTGTATYYVCYDANGNVSEYLDNSGGIAAHYEYSPFGKAVVKTGAMPDDFRIRFSTKYQCVASDDYDYGLRDYDSVSGRWRSRDPIEEEGGFNLYCMLRNNVIDKIDFCGTTDTQPLPRFTPTTWRPPGTPTPKIKVPLPVPSLYAFRVCCKQARREYDNNVKSCDRLCPKEKQKCYDDMYKLLQLEIIACAGKSFRIGPSTPLPNDPNEAINDFKEFMHWEWL